MWRLEAVAGSDDLISRGYLSHGTVKIGPDTQFFF